MLSVVKFVKTQFYCRNRCIKWTSTYCIRYHIAVKLVNTPLPIAELVPVIVFDIKLVIVDVVAFKFVKFYTCNKHISCCNICSIYKKKNLM
jgi:hypothetical protein